LLLEPVSDDNDETVGLRIIHITDVYILENFPSLKTLIKEYTSNEPGIKTISMLTGDFLMPYLLSSVDGGLGMMTMMNAVPIDYLTWGNHEKDLEHEELMEREKEYEGIWINTNMKSHESFENSTCQIDHDIIDLKTDRHQRKIALLGILTDEAALYPPGSFNGATIDDPWETMNNYNIQLQNDVDLVLPLCHLYEAQDERTAQEFDFPLILGGHDHHPVDRVINETLLLKPGADAHFARVIDISWKSADDDKPTIEHELLKVSDFKPDVDLQKVVEEAYTVLNPLRFTQLGFIPDHLRPLSSTGSRSERSSVATFLGGEICDAIPDCDAFAAKGGNFRGGRDYGADEEYSLELLRSEFGNVTVFVAELPGHILRTGLNETWKTPGSGWFQYDESIVVDREGHVVSVGGEPLELNRMYRIATFQNFFRARDGPTIGKYFEENPTKIPEEGYSVYDLLLKHAAETFWETARTELDWDGNGFIDHEEFKRIDTDNNGYMDRREVVEMLEKIGNLETHIEEDIFVDHIVATATAQPSRIVTASALNAAIQKKPRKNESWESETTNHAIGSYIIQDDDVDFPKLTWFNAMMETQESFHNSTSQNDHDPDLLQENFITFINTTPAWIHIKVMGSVLDVEHYGVMSLVS